MIGLVSFGLIVFNTAWKPPAFTCGRNTAVENSQSVFQSALGLHPSRPQSAVQTNWFSTSTLHPSVRPSVQQGRGGGVWRGSSTFKIPFEIHHFASNVVSSTRGSDHNDATTFNSNGHQNKQLLSAAASRGASLDSVRGLVVPDEKLQQLVPPVESVSELAQLAGHFDGDRELLKKKNKQTNT